MSAEFIATAALRATLLLALGLAALRWLPVARPQLRRVAALFCLGASLVVPFLLVRSTSLVLPHFSQPLSGASSWPVSIFTVAWIFAGLWISGGLLAALRLVSRGMALHRWMARCTVVQPEAATGMGVPVRVCRDATAPCVAGFLHPVLIVPQKAHEWDEATWRCVLEHELQHVRQGDLWLGWIAHVARVLHWWNPLAWHLARGVGLECEACCDDAVLRKGVQAADYARVLLRFTTTEEAPQPAGFFIHGRTPSSLRLRVERLLGDASRGVSAWRVTMMLCLLAAGIGGCVWLGFEREHAVSSAADLKAEGELRWQANPFPSDPQ